MSSAANRDLGLAVDTMTGFAMGPELINASARMAAGARAGHKAAGLRNALYS
jgi:hypothetical protein